MTGSKSEAFLHRGAAALAGLLVQGGHHRLEGVNHSAVVAAPTKLAVVVTDFLKEECLGEFARQPGAVHLALSGLAPAAVGVLVEQRAGTAVPDAVVDLVHDRSGGNPFFVRELVALLASEERLTVGLAGAADRHRVPAAVQDVIRRRISRLPPDAQQLLTAASVVGRTFDVEVLAAVAGGMSPTTSSTGWTLPAAPVWWPRTRSRGGTGSPTHWWPRRWPPSSAVLGGPGCTPQWCGPSRSCGARLLGRRTWPSWRSTPTRASPPEQHGLRTGTAGRRPGRRPPVSPTRMRPSTWPRPPRSSSGPTRAPPACATRRWWNWARLAVGPTTSWVRTQPWSRQQGQQPRPVTCWAWPGQRPGSTRRACGRRAITEPRLPMSSTSWSAPSTPWTRPTSPTACGWTCSARWPSSSTTSDRSNGSTPARRKL